MTLLRALIPSIIGEIVNLNGKGPEAQKQIDQFNSICNKFGVNADVSVSGGIGTNQTAKDAIAEQLTQKLESSFKAVLLSGVKGNNADMIVMGGEKLNKLQEEYKQIIEDIQLDKSDIHLDSVKTHPQINSLISLVKEINEATSMINKGSENKKYDILDEKITPYTQYLGQIENTMITIWNRIDKISTWSIILVCLFIDLLVPLAIYLLLRKKGPEFEDKSLQGNIKPSSF